MCFYTVSILQIILRQCVDDVRAQLHKHAPKSTSVGGVVHASAHMASPDSLVHYEGKLGAISMGRRARPHSAVVRSTNSRMSDISSNDTAYHSPVKRKMAPQRPASAIGSFSLASSVRRTDADVISMPGSDLSAKDREAIVRQLLAKEAVLLLLHKATFPTAVEMPPDHACVGLLSEHQASQQRRLLLQAMQKKTPSKVTCILSFLLHCNTYLKFM